MSEISEKLKPADLMRAIEYALRRSPVTETVFSEEGDFDTEITEPASLEAFATTLISEVVPHIMAAALSSAAVAEREPVAFVSAMAIRHHIDSGTSQTGTVLHREQGELYGEKHLALYLDPPPTSELEAEIARLRDELRIANEKSIYEKDRTDVAEAPLAEAMKALELARADILEWVSSFPNADHTKSLDALAAIDNARRVREGGKVE